MVASDLDGTLLPPELQVLPQTRVGVARLRDAGVPVIVCTGRMVQSARRVAVELGLQRGLIVCYGGAVVARLEGGPWLRHRPLQADAAAAVVRFARRERRHVNAYVDDELHVDEVDEWARRYAAYAQVRLTVVDDLLELVASRSCTKLLITTPPDEADGVVTDLRRRFAGRVAVARSLAHFIEVNDAAVSKADALGWLCAREGWRTDRTVACGDGQNDLDMIRWAALGVAVEEGAEEVRAVADLVVPRAGLGALFERLAAPPSD